MTKTCLKCREVKPWDPTAKQDSKASGFKGKKCWGCFVEASRLRQQQLVALTTGEVISYTAAANRRNYSTEEGRKKHVVASSKSQKMRKQTDKWFQLRLKLAATANRLLKAIGRGRSKDETILSHFGATREEVYAYLDIQLRERGFSWANHGTEWVGDHIKPLAIAQDSNELMRLCHLPNLQVLTPDENRRKGIEDAKLVKQFEA